MSRGSTAFDSIINTAADAWNVPQPLIKAIVEQESDFDPNAYRAEPQIDDASRGLMQLLYGTAQALGFQGEPNDLFDPTINIRLGTRYLSELINTAARYGYGVDSAISAYNAGFSTQRTGDGKRMGNSSDTPFINQAYVDRVLSAANAYATEARGEPQQLPTVTTFASSPTAGAPNNRLFYGVLIVILILAIHKIAMDG